MSNKETGHRKNALGRGLNALLQDSSYFTEQGHINPLREIAIEQIEVNPLQPRRDFNPKALQELSDSIQVHGVIQPLTVRQIGPNQYQLIAGERRLQAAKKAGLAQVPTYIRTANDQEVLEMALVENIQRESLNPIEIALSYQRLLVECNIKQEILGTRVGKNRTTVNNYLRLLKLPPDIQIALRDQKISMGHARALVNIENTAAQLDILQKTMQNELSVRKVEELARACMLPKQPKPRKQQKKEFNLGGVEPLMAKLTKQLDTPIKIHAYAQGQGELRINFVDHQDLTRIIQMLVV